MGAECSCGEPEAPGVIHDSRGLPCFYASNLEDVHPPVAEGWMAGGCNCTWCTDARSRLRNAQASANAYELATTKSGGINQLAPNDDDSDPNTFAAKRFDGFGGLTEPAIGLRARRFRLYPTPRVRGSLFRPSGTERGVRPSPLNVAVIRSIGLALRSLGKRAGQRGVAVVRKVRIQAVEHKVRVRAGVKR